jgi:hypothetical protein
LHQILAVGRLQEAKPALHQPLQQGHKLAQHAGICDAVTILRGLHECCKSAVIGGGLRRRRFVKRRGPQVLRIPRSARRSIHCSLRCRRIIAVTVSTAGPARTPLPPGHGEHKAAAGLLKYPMAMEPIRCCYAQKAGDLFRSAGGPFAGLVGKALGYPLELLGMAEKYQMRTK